MKLEKPFNGEFRITQKFGARPSAYKRFGLAGHDGLDWAVPNGTDLLAPMAGKTYVGWAPTTWGLFYSITNNWGTVYLAHLKENFLPTGVNVSSHQLIGHTDNTGNSTGPHLHIGLRVKGISNPKMKNFVDPLPYLTEKEEESVVNAGQGEAIKAYQQDFEDINIALKLPAGNKDTAVVRKKCVELLQIAENYKTLEGEHTDFVKEVAKGIGCKETSKTAISEALAGLSSLRRDIMRKKLSEFNPWLRIGTGILDLLKIGGEKK